VQVQKALANRIEIVPRRRVVAPGLLGRQTTPNSRAATKASFSAMLTDDPPFTVVLPALVWMQGNEVLPLCEQTITSA